MVIVINNCKLKEVRDWEVLASSFSRCFHAAGVRLCVHVVLRGLRIQVLNFCRQDPSAGTPRYKYTLLVVVFP